MEFFRLRAQYWISYFRSIFNYVFIACGHSGFAGNLSLENGRDTINVRCLFFHHKVIYYNLPEGNIFTSILLFSDFLTDNK